MTSSQEALGPLRSSREAGLGSIVSRQQFGFKASLLVVKSANCFDKHVKNSLLKKPHLLNKVDGAFVFFNNDIYIYRAKLMARFSLITVTLICPGYCISFCIFCEIINDNSSAFSSGTRSLSTITLSSLPACIA